MNIYTIIIFDIIICPVVALLDYFALRNNFKLITGNNPPRFYWIWPCILELMCFNAGLLVGASQ